MADGEKKSSRTLVFLKDHGEKVFLGGALAALALYGALALLPNGADAAIHDPIVIRPQLEKGRAHPEFAAPPVRPWFEEFHGRQNTVKECRAGNPWIATSLPVIVSREVVPAPARRTVILFPAVVLGAAQVTPHSVSLSWSVNPVPPADKAQKLVDYLSFPITHFHVERQTAGQEDWLAVGDLPADAKGFRDDGVLPGRKYKYRVIGAHEKAESVALTAEPLATPSQWKLTFRTPTENSVYVTIEKVDREQGALPPVHRFHQAGDRIGWWSEKSGQEPVSMHWVSKIGRPAEVDLDTGVTLLSVRAEKVDAVHRKCAKKVAGPGVICVNGDETVKVSTTAIVLRDAEREWTVYEPVVTGRDLRCPDHRGK